MSEACLVAYLRHPTEVPLPGGGTSQEHPQLVVRLRADTIGPLPLPLPLPLPQP